METLFILSIIAILSIVLMPTGGLFISGPLFLLILAVGFKNDV
jgi:hypothetical protein